MYDTRDSGSKTPAQRAAEAYEAQRRKNQYGNTTGGTVKSNSPAKQAAANYNSQRASGNYGTTSGGTVSTGTKLATGSSGSSRRSSGSSTGRSVNRSGSYVSAPVRTAPVQQVRSRTASYTLPAAGYNPMNAVNAAVAAYKAKRNAAVADYSESDDNSLKKAGMEKGRALAQGPMSAENDAVAAAIASYNAQKNSGDYGTTGGTAVKTTPYYEKKNPDTGAEPAQPQAAGAVQYEGNAKKMDAQPQGSGSWGYTQDQINGLNSIGIQPYNGSTGWGKYISQQDLETHPGVASAIASGENENHQVVDMYGNYMTLGELYYYMAKGFYDKVDGNQGWGMVGGTGRGTSYDPDTGWKDSDGIDDGTGAAIEGWTGFGAGNGADGYGADGYGSMSSEGQQIVDAIRESGDAQVQALKNQKDQINAQYDKAAKDAYAAYTKSKLAMPEQMSGTASGTADSLTMQADLNYQNVLAQNEQNRASALAELDAQIGQKQAEVEQQAAQTAAEWAQKAYEERMAQQQAAAKAQTESTADAVKTTRKTTGQTQKAKAETGAGTAENGMTITNDLGNDMYFIRGLGRFSSAELSGMIASGKVKMVDNGNGTVTYKAA